MNIIKINYSKRNNASNIEKPKYRILIVDDNDFNLLILKQILTDIKINFYSLYQAINSQKEISNEQESFNDQLKQQCIHFDIDEAIDGNIAV